MTQYLSQSLASEVAGITDRRLRQLEKEDNPPPRKPEGYPAKEFGQWLISRESGDRYDLTKERARLAKWQADEKELDVAVKRGDLIPADEVVQTWARLVVSAKALLLSLPDRLQQMFTLEDTDRDAIDREIRSVLEKLSDYDTSAESD